MSFVERNGITVAHWPAKSPDLNPIERIWALMKRSCSVRSKGPGSLRELRRAALAAWREVTTPETCATLYRALPESLEHVIERHGTR